LHISRRKFVRLTIGTGLAAPWLGCRQDYSNLGRLEKIWGRAGIVDGRFQKPRAMAIDGDDQLYIVDMLARIQVFDRDGNFLRSWRTPEFAAGRPTGLTVSPDGRLLVADTHYFRILSYTLAGDLLEESTLGGRYGPEPGQFGLVTDAVRDGDGTWYVSEYGEFDRIHKFSPDGQFLLQWGGHGSEPGQFLRPQTIELAEDGRLWVVDACNHRIQIFDLNGQLTGMWGEAGSELGQLYYPYGLDFDGQGHVYVCEYGNHRVQKFTLTGQSLGSWGTNGRGPGELHNPWALVCDSQGSVHVLDSNNHRVQRIAM
jgi:sugar lactone lactonase YvrE